MKDEKKRIRETIGRLLRGLSRNEILEKSRMIEKRFLSSPEFNSCESILSYVSIPLEPETRGIMGEALSQKKLLFAPKVEGDYVCVCRLESLSHLRPGRFGIPEPPGSARCEIRDFDLVLVPGVAFDKAGRRLGHGGGFYDRLLSSLSGEFIALAFDNQVIGRVPDLEHDVRVHKIFTERRVVDCRKK